MKNKLKGGVGAVIIIILSIFGSKFYQNDDGNIEEILDYAFSEEVFENHEIIEVDGGDLSGDRLANVVVDVGYGDREYWSFTNEYGQVVMVIAEKIILQDDYSEPVLESGRYYPDEADVSGTELKEYDQGHVIADSLGGVANAYNITPQQWYVNRKGKQAKIEGEIRKNKGCKDFVCVIEYPDNISQIPSSYLIIYRINGILRSERFKNSR